MQIEKCKHPTKCDFVGCSNLADYQLSTKGLLKRELAFCEKCLREMYVEIAKLQVPKAVEAPFKIKKRLRKEER